MEEELQEKYEKIKDKISEEQFLRELDENMEKEKDNPFMTRASAADMVVGKYNVNEENEVLSEKEEYAMDKINKLEPTRGANVTGTVMSISSPKKFTSRKGNSGRLCNVELADDTGSMRVVFWTQNMNLLNNFKEGDIIRVNNVDIRDGYSGLEAHMGARSTVNNLDKNDFPNFPTYHEEITNISDIEDDTKVNIIARIVKIPPIRNYNSNGKEGEVTSLILQDETGKISYTLWNKDVKLIEDLGLESGDAVKILGAQARERNGELSLSHWGGKIEKGDFDVPDFSDEPLPIIDVKTQPDVTILGVISKVYDVRKFQRSDGSEGQLKSFVVSDETSHIRVTVWGAVADMEFNKGDIIKISGANARYDEYTDTGYSLNTGWNTEIKLSPTISLELEESFEEIRSQLRPIPLSEVALIDDEGIEIDVMGRILTINDLNEFERDDGSVAYVRSVGFSDGTEVVNVSFWEDKAKDEYNVGEAYLIENARPRLGTYSVDLNVGNSARVIKLDESEPIDLPAIETLEKLVYDKKSIIDLDEDDEYALVIARVFEINEIREFDRADGSKGKVRNIEIADNSGTIRVTLWDKDAEREFEVGEAIKLQNPRVTFNNDHLEITVSRSTGITEPNESETENLPTYEELKDSIYQEKTIEMLEDADTNVHITGQIIAPMGERLLRTRCPHCNNSIEEFDDEYVCDYCGEVIDEPDYLLMIPAKLEDDTGEIPVVFFNKLAEELLDMSKEEIINITQESVDLGAIEGKVDDLEGLNVELIANVTFNEFDEEMRLSPKKILSKFY